MFFPRFSFRSLLAITLRIKQIYREKFHKKFGVRIQHTYKIGHYNPSVKIIDLVSYTTYVVRVHFIHKWQDLQFKVDSERQIF